ncbi:hypothetical protein SEA_STIGMA_107 [Streptomyces phage Stigma]|nr:hypothetical protein SEA_STIGMA_107 [Streptomyces phage Stigma]
MLRKNSSWQNWSKTYGSPRKRNDRAFEKRQWVRECQSES